MGMGWVVVVASRLNPLASKPLILSLSLNKKHTHPPNSFFPPVVYGFACEPGPRAFYLISTTLLGLATLWVTLDPSFQAPRYRPFRAALFSLLGTWGVAPATHALLLHWGEPAHAVAFAHYVAMGALYLGGAAIFAARVPERWAPGRFDLLGNSHQLFHVAIVAAAAVHCRGVLGMMHWRDSVGGCHV
jgi:adiponectin receptor